MKNTKVGRGVPFPTLKTLMISKKKVMKVILKQGIQCLNRKNKVRLLNHQVHLSKKKKEC